jgi:cyclohexanone monooxygenase
MQLHPDIIDLIGGVDFDPEALHERYLAERDRRVRAEGQGQYQEVKGAFAHFIDDPYVEPGFERAPVADAVEFTIIGGGFGCLLLAARLRARGVKTIRVVEAGGDFGGTWYWNRYPGAQCDVESYIYLPLLEEMGYTPRHKYAFAPEILEYTQKVARHLDLYKDALFQTRITDLSWDDGDGVWQVRTQRGDAFTSRFVAMANGPLNRPKLPGIPGIETFAGHTFHTSRWDYAYTGGDAYGGLDKLADKRVGIIGTGATAVQCIPHLGASARELYVFQRTPSSVDVRANRPTDPQWAASLPHGWQRGRMENFNILVSGGEAEEDLVADGWTDIFRNITGVRIRALTERLGRRLTAEERSEVIALCDYKKMNAVRARVDALVNDPATAEKLKPWYRQFCKRPCFNDEYLQTFNRPNVHLVDTEGRGVERVTPSGVVVGGREYPLDLIIFATGFEVGTAYTRRAAYEVTGRDGETLTHRWAEGVRTLHGVMAHKYPNCFFLGLTQAPAVVNFPMLLEEQCDHIAAILDAARERGAARIEPTAEGEAGFVDAVRSGSDLNTRFYQECTPGYYNSEGEAGNRNGFFSEAFGAGTLAFLDLVRGWRATGRFEGVSFS